MKRYVILMALALSLAMPTSAFALEVPSETIVQNLNGSQQVIKTYTISPEADPQELIEEPFTLEGYRYTFADIVKVENHVQDSHQQTETVTVETSKNDLGLILEKLAPTLDYCKQLVYDIWCSLFYFYFNNFHCFSFVVYATPKSLIRMLFASAAVFPLIRQA